MASLAKLPIDLSRRYTIEEFEALPNDGNNYELVDGELILVPSPFYAHGLVVGTIFKALCDFVMPRGLGDLVSNDSGTVLHRNPDTLRGADVAFISAARRPDKVTPRMYMPVPDLVVEVRSPSETTRYVWRKVSDYMQAGVRVLWFVEPDTRSLTVHRPGLSSRTLSESDILDGDDVLPGFRFPVRDLFVRLG